MAPRHQTRLDDFTPSITRVVDNLLPTGDHIPNDLEPHLLRFAFQNIHGATLQSGLSLPDKIEAMSTWNTDIMGMSETNRPWTPQQRAEYDYMMNLRFNSSRTLYTAALTPSYDTKYLPGGNLLTINGRTTGRISDSGSDEWGRFCWYTLLGRRDEGILLLVAYRVCHEAHDNPGPFTAYQQQYMAMRQAGYAKPNPRKQILDDMSKLINEKRLLGFRPIVMMDARTTELTTRTWHLSSLPRDWQTHSMTNSLFPHPLIFMARND